MSVCARSATALPAGARVAALRGESDRARQRCGSRLGAPPQATAGRRLVGADAAAACPPLATRRRQQSPRNQAWQRPAAASVHPEGAEEEGPTTTRRGALALAAGTVLAVAGPAAPSSAKIVVPSRSSTPAYEATKVGEERREALEKERGEVQAAAYGVRYREPQLGYGKEVQRGTVVSIMYQIYQANGSYIDSVGYGNDAKNDLGEVYRFRYGAGQVPLGLEIGMEGMRVGGKRRIEIPPNVGWTEAKLGPVPEGKVAQYRLEKRKSKINIMEVELVRVGS